VDKTWQGALPKPKPVPESLIFWLSLTVGKTSNCEGPNSVPWKEIDCVRATEVIAGGSALRDAVTKRFNRNLIFFILGVDFLGGPRSSDPGRILIIPYLTKKVKYFFKFFCLSTFSRFCQAENFYIFRLKFWKHFHKVFIDFFINIVYNNNVKKGRDDLWWKYKKSLGTLKNLLTFSLKFVILYM
jgi:hypothetical protein